jgi:hypothetical protein
VAARFFEPPQNGCFNCPSCLASASYRREPSRRPVSFLEAAGTKHIPTKDYGDSDAGGIFPHDQQESSSATLAS